MLKSMSKLKYHFGIKIRVYPNDTQKDIIKFNADSSRFIYNELVASEKYAYDIKQHYGRDMYYNPTIFEWYQEKRRNMTTKQMRLNHEFLNDKRLDSDNIATTIRNHQKAWNNHKQNPKKFGIPTYHKKAAHPYDYSYQTSTHYRIDKNGNQVANVRFDDDYKHLKLPKLGWIKVAYLRSFLKERNNIRFGTITITKDALDHYYVSIALASDLPFKASLQKTNSTIAYDMNVSDFIVDPNGNTVDNPRYLKHSLKKLAHTQRKLNRQRKANHGRKLKNCKNYQKTRLLLSKMYNHVVQQRNNFLNELSMSVIKNHDVVIVENLNSKKMVKTHFMAQSVSDAAWRTFITMLSYKAALYEKTLIKIDPKNTTQRCHLCGNIKDKTDKVGLNGNKKHHTNHYQYVCYNPNCSAYLKVQNRDVNAANNILQKGLNVW